MITQLITGGQIAVVLLMESNESNRINRSKILLVLVLALSLLVVVRRYTDEGQARSFQVIRGPLLLYD